MKRNEITNFTHIKLTGYWDGEIACYVGTGESPPDNIGYCREDDTHLHSDICPDCEFAVSENKND